MVLIHKTRYCDIHKTRILRAPVFKHHIKNISPYKIYADNVEMFDAFADTVANFSPISINIVDYWNKSTKTNDTYVYSPVEGTIEAEITDPAFGWRRSENKGFRNKNASANPYYGIEDVLDANGNPVLDANGKKTYKKISKKPDPNNPSDKGLGFPVKEGDGRLLGTKRRSYVEGDNEREDGSCMDYHKRFFINPIIGVQDKLALTYLNNFYSTYYNARQNPTLRHRLMNIASDPDNDINASTFFHNPNALFDEEKTVANKTFIQKKGTAIGLRYAQKSAFDAELQGPMSRFMMRIKTPEPLVYHIESNILEDIFEKFVKPLAHPIGFIYDYRAVCEVLGAEDIDHPMINYRYKSKLIEVNCLCQKKYKDNLHNHIGKQLIDPLNVDQKNPYDIICGGKDQPESKVFALDESTLYDTGKTMQDPKDPDNPDAQIPVMAMRGLWENIKEDEAGILGSDGYLHFNILKHYKHSYGMFRGGIHEYKKWTFDNDNYLTAWTIQSKVQDEAPKVVITYHRKNYSSVSGWDLVLTLENELHCNVADNLQSTRDSQIEEEFSIICVPSKNGPFIMDVQPGSTPDNSNGPEVQAPIYKGDNLGKDADGNDIIKFRGFMTWAKTDANGKPIGRMFGGKLVGYSVFTNPIHLMNQLNN